MCFLRDSRPWAQVRPWHRTSSATGKIWGCQMIPATEQCGTQCLSGWWWETIPEKEAAVRAGGPSYALQGGELGLKPPAQR